MKNIVRIFVVAAACLLVSGAFLLCVGCAPPPSRRATPEELCQGAADVFEDKCSECGASCDIEGLRDSCACVEVPDPDRLRRCLAGVQDEDCVLFENGLTPSSCFFTILVGSCP